MSELWRTAGTRTLETPRLTLRRYRLEDAQGVFENWASDPATSRFFTWSAHEDVRETQSVIQMWLDGYSAPGYYHWLLALRPEGRPVGAVFLDEIDVQAASAYLSGLLGSRYWGQALAAEAYRAVLDYAFSLGFARMRARCHEDNAASGRALEKAGLRRVGSERRSYPEAPQLDGRYLLYEAMPGEWTRL